MKLAFRLKGGPGSGHRDHKGIPNHQGGSLPADKSPVAKSAGTLVHRGMGLDKISNIMSEGIKRVKATIGDRPESVYFMTDKNDIYDYVAELYTDNDEGFAIVEFTIPEEFSKSILEDEEEGNSFRIEKDIPAEWIGNIYYYDNRGKPISKPEILKSLKKSIRAYTSFGFSPKQVQRT